MKVTQIHVIPIKGYPRMRASVNIVLDEVLKVKDIHIIAKKNGQGVDVIFPERRTSRGDYFAVVYPINKEFRTETVKAILDEYYRVLKESNNNDVADAPSEIPAEAEDSDDTADAMPEEEPDLE